MIKRLAGHLREMREHRWTGAHLSAYLDREVSESERARLERHARICPQCHRMLETLRRTLAGLRAMSGANPDPPADLTDAVMERLRD